MYVGKRIKSILSVLLIIGLLVVSVPSRAYAFGPVFLVPALSPAMKYAIGAGIVAGGLYAANQDALNYAISDYWNKASDHVKSMWNNAVIYGTGIGVILLNDPLKSSIKDYLDDNYGPGEVYKRGADIEIPSGFNYPPDIVEYFNDAEYIVAVLSNGSVLYCRDIVQSGTYTKDGVSYPKYTYYFDFVFRGNTKAWGKDHYWHRYVNIAAPWSSSSSMSPPRIVEIGADFVVVKYLEEMTYGEPFYNEVTKVIDFAASGVIESELVDYGYVGDGAGFGNATDGRPDIKVPCPPVPAAEWPDNWIDDLQEEMNRTGNPTLDDETSIEEWEDEYEWYLDEFGNIYKVKKGQAPRKPEDEPLRIPGPPLPAPDVPENYPTEDDPDLTIEHHPPQTTVIENPDGSRTETTTQTTTTTRKWWDPSSQRWRTTITDTTTTTTVDFDPDGIETGRTTTTTTQPKGEREETAQPDDTAIDWEPLRRGLYELTEKFPFCLPWDLMRGIQSLESNQWDRKIIIEVGDGIWPAMVIDLSMFDNIASITRVILLIVFDLGLIFGTRKLMGGDV